MTKSSPVAAARPYVVPTWAQPDFIPAELRELPQWVNHRAPKDKKPRRLDGELASSTDDTTWADYHLAVGAAEHPSNNFTGIGFVFTANDPYVGIDLDHCIVDGEIQDWAIEMIRKLEQAGAWIEYSPSGDGLHAYLRGTIPNAVKPRWIGFEMYDRGRYFTVTGNRYSGGETIPEAQELLDELHARFSVKPPDPEPAREGIVKFTTRSKGGSDPLARASAYLAKVDPAISGQRGHDTAFRAACVIGPGFDLTPAEAIHLLRNEYNPRCVPPWSDREIQHKVEEAYKVEARRGWLLNAEPKNGKARRSNNDTASSNGHYEGNGYHEEGPDRFEIEVTTEEHKVVDNAILALTREPNLYQRAKTLVAVIEDVKPEKKKKGISRPPGAPQIVTLPSAQVRRLMSVHAYWWKWKKTRSGDEVAVPTNIPSWAVEITSTMKTWKGIRPLEGITEIPTFRPDGSLIMKPGYDEDTGLFYQPSIEFPEIPESPSREKVETCVNGLKYLVSDFPFAGSWASWLAAMLTPMARFAIDGPCPLFLIDANVAGAGKTKLVDLIALALTGRIAARGTYSEDDVEMRKLITSFTVVGDRIILFDNVEVGGQIGGPSLDRYLTAGTWNDRILGRSEMTGDLDAISVLYATGNNLGIKGDALRRIVPIPLKSLEERPEERTGFTIKDDLLEHFQANRAGYVTMALTILRGYIAAGRPTFNLTPMDYTAWCGLIRNAVKWATDIDPCEGRSELIKNDDATNRNKALVKEWKALCELVNMSAMTAGEAIENIAANPKQTETIRRILQPWAKEGNNLPSPQKLGNELAKIRGKNYGGLELCRTEITGSNTWHVRSVLDA